MATPARYREDIPARVRILPAIIAIGILPATPPDARAQQRQAQLIVQNGDASEGIQTVAFSPDGRLFLTGAAQMTVDGLSLEKGDEGRSTSAFLWDAATGRELRELRGHLRPVFCTAIAPDDTTLLTVGLDRTARLWKAATGRGMEWLDTTGLAPTACAWSPRGNQIALGAEHGFIRLFDAHTHKLLRTVHPGAGRIVDLAYSPDGRWLGAADGRHLLLLRSAAPEHAKAAGSAVRNLRWSPDGKYVDTAEFDFDYEGLIEPTRNRRSVLTLKTVATNEVIEFSNWWPTPDGRRVFQGHNMTDVQSGEDLWTLRSASSGSYVQFVRGDQSLLVYSGSREEDKAQTTLWGLNQGAPLRVFATPNSPFDAVSLDDKSLCIETTNPRQPLIVDPMTGQDLPTGSSGCYDVSVSSAAQETAEELMIRYGLRGESGGLSPDGRYFIAQEQDAAYVHDATTGQLVVMCVGDAVTFSRDSSRVLCSDDQKIAHIIRLQNAAESNPSGVAKPSNLDAVPRPGVKFHDRTLEVRDAGTAGEARHIDNVLAYFSAPKTEQDSAAVDERQCPARHL